jgi:hypothetical protein
MATSTNYGWAEPDNASLVKNGASDIRTLGNAIDASVWSVGFGQAGKNKIINGNFATWQRGTSFTSTATGYYYSADRWVSYAQSGTSSTISRQTFTPGTAPVAGYEGQYFIRFNDTAGSGTTLFQRIENVQTFAGQTVTVSYWIKSAGTTTITTNLSQNFGSGGSASVNTLAIASFTPTTSWTRVTGTVAVPSITGKTVGTSGFLEFQINGSATNVAVDVWGVQVEAGSTATPFQTASGGSPQAELAMCQRYYAKTYPIGTAAATVTNNGVLTYKTAFTDSFQMFASWRTPVEMRSTPTVTLYSPNTGATGKIYTGAADVNGTASGYIASSGISPFVNNVSIVSGNLLVVHLVAEAEL